MRFDILTLFPEIIEQYCRTSILGRGQKAGVIEARAHDFRKYTKDKHNHVDDRPYGGGPGMILQIQPIFDCLKAVRVLRPSFFRGSSVIPAKAGIQSRRTGDLDSRFHGNDKKRKTKIIILDPAGKKFDQKMAKRFSKLDRLVLISGRYEGFDERVYKLADEKVSVGDYVLAGGELPVLIIVEAVARLLPGVLGNPKSLAEETFNKSQTPITNDQSNPKTQNSRFKIQNCELELENFVEYPQYTRPEEFMGWRVPKVLLSGDHGKIREWRRKRTARKIKE